jgi:hypothetical protein
MVTLYERTQNINNEAFLWNIAVLGMEKPPVCAGTSCPLPMLVFYIPPCRKTFMAWRNVKCQHGRVTKCSHINRGLFHFQNCKFSEESFILISFCYSVDGKVHVKQVEAHRCLPWVKGAVHNLDVPNTTTN